MDEINFNEATLPSTGNVYINIASQPLPESVTVPTGCCVAFVRTRGVAGGRKRKKGPIAPDKDFLRVLLPMGKNGIVAVKLPDQPENTDLIAVLQSKSAGGSLGDIEIQRAPSNPMCDPYPPELIRYFIK